MPTMICEIEAVARLHLDRPGQPRTSGVIREDQCQIDSWLRDIEQRCGDREQEWRSQQAKLQAELN